MNEQTFEEIRNHLERKRQITQEQKENGRQTILEMMLKHNIGIIKVGFSGSGDSGCVDDISVVNESSQDAWNGKPLKDINRELYEHVDTYVDNYLNTCGVDWYNNEGGQGVILFDTSVVPHIFEATVEYNFMHSEVGHYTEEVL
jgi:hypothetical protein